MPTGDRAYLDRRAFLEWLWVLGAASALPGCADYPILRDPADVCDLPPQPLQRGGSPLRIDVHCHVFNAADLQVVGFIEKVQNHDWNLVQWEAEAIALLANGISWAGAPSACEELWRIRAARFTSWIGSLASTGPAATAVRRLIEEDETRAEAEIARVVNSDSKLRALLLQNLGPSPRISARGVRPLTTAEVELVRKRLATGSVEFEDLTRLDTRQIGKAVFSFLKPLLRHRYTNCYQLLRAYSCADQAIDLFVPSLVDFDHWLGPDQPKSPVARQLDVMEEVMRLMGGSVHCFVPFNPWSRLADPDYFAMLQHAVQERGFIGFKIYPPMGFAPYGNEALEPGERPASWPDPQFGASLDRSMLELFRWCSSNRVPILAHSNPSNAPDCPSERMGSPAHWNTALAAMHHAGFTPPRICFGHFGGDFIEGVDDLGQEPGSGDGEQGRRKHAQWGAEFAGILSTEPTCFADISYWEHFIPGNSPKGREGAIERLRSLATASPEVATRLLYGTDWNMLAMEVDWQRYLAGTREALMEVFPGNPSAVDSVLGRNAAAFLGLADASPTGTRRRLEAVYAKRWKIDAPGWMKKLDTAGGA